MDDDVRIIGLDPLTEPDLLQAWVDASTASGRAEFGDQHTVYSADEIRERQREATDDRVELVAAVGSGGLVVGTSRIAMPLLDNQSILSASVEVRPDHRRRGVGSLLLAEVERRAAASGRPTVLVESDLALTTGAATTAFAARHGYADAQQSLRQGLDLSAGAAAVVARLPQDPVDEYTLETYWDDVPEKWLDDRAVLSARMSTDAPMGDVDVEPEVWDADRVREQLRVARAQGRRVVETVALGGDGHLVAFTTMAVASHTPGMAYQWDTLVLREHRGHGLGRRVKATNLQALLTELPDVRRVVTWNASDNVPMLAVNAAIGFEVVGVLTEWQKHLPT